MSTLLKAVTEVRAVRKSVVNAKQALSKVSTDPTLDRASLMVLVALGEEILEEARKATEQAEL